MGRRATAIGIALALGGVGACASGHRSVERGPQTAHVRVTTFDPAQRNKVLYTQIGVLDYTHRRGAFRMDLNPGQTSAAQINAIVAGHVELLRLSADARKQYPPPVTAGKHWITQPGRFVRDTPTAANPFTELASLREKNVKLADRGTAHVNGQTVHHYRRVVTKSVTRAGTKQVERVTYDYFSDSHDRLVRMVAETARDADHIGLRTQIDFSDLGAPARVAVPPASDVVQYSTAIAPTPKLEGSWTQVASGRNATFAWKLFRAPADIDRECWSFEATPPLHAATPAIVGSVPTAAQMRAAMGSTGPWPQHDGHDAVCTRTGSWQTDLQPIAGGVDGRASTTVAVLAPDIVKATARFAFQGISPTQHGVSIDARFHGFVDLAAPPPLHSPEGGSGYVLTRRDGSHVSCNPSTAFTAMLGSVLDPCRALPSGTTNGNVTSIAISLQPHVPTFP